MKDALNSKIEDYSAYVVQAVKNFRKGHYGDSASNCRKAAEAACKILFFNAYSLKIAEGKTLNKGLKELILQVIKDSVAERKAINNIEALQIIGNKAAHDNLITPAEAGYALNALDLLTQYLFIEKLKIRIPSSLNFEEEEKKIPEPKTEIIEKIIIRESPDPEKEEALLKKFAFIEKQNQELKDQINENIKEIRHYGEIQNSQALSENPSPETIQAPAKEEKKKPRVFILSVVVVLFLLLIIFWYFFSYKTTTLEIPVAKLGDTVYVAINSLNVLQDNPNMDFKIETILQSYIKKTTLLFSLPVKCVFTDFKKGELTADTAILLQAGRLNYDVVYWGNLYESSLADSNLLEIKGCLTSNHKFFRNKKIKFRSLADSAFIKEMNDQGNTPAYIYCRIQENGKDFKKLAAVLGNLHSFSNENFMALNDLRSVYLEYSEQYTEAVFLTNSLIKKEPIAPFYNTLGSIYLRMYKYDSAEVNLKRGYEKDSLYTSLLLTYAILNLYLKENDKALNYLEKILKINKNNKEATALIYRIKHLKKGQFLSPNDYIEADDKAENFINKEQYDEALKWYLEAGRILNLSADRKVQIAKCYFKLGDTTNALNYIRMAESQDSTGENLIVFTAVISEDILSLSKKTDDNYKKALSLYPENIFLLQRASDHYMRFKNFKRCIEIGLLADKKYPNDKMINTNTALSALLSKNYRLANSKYEFLNLMYPSDTSLAYLAQSYLSSSGGNIRTREFALGVNLIKKAYALNPNNTITGGIYERYADLAVMTMESDKAFKGNEQTKKNIADYKKLMESVSSPAQLYSDKTLTITTSLIGTTITKRYNNGSEKEVMHPKKGGSSSYGMRAFKGQMPPKNEPFPTEKQIIDFVIANKKLSNPVLLDFLTTELIYCEKMLRSAPKENTENQKLVDEITLLIAKLQEKKK